MGQQDRSDRERFFSDLQALLPAVAVVPEREISLRSFARRAPAGVAGVAHIAILDPSVPEPLKVSVPAGDAMAEATAVAIDTALAIRRRFKPVIDEVEIWFDKSSPGLRAGTARARRSQRNCRQVHLDPASISSRALEKARIESAVAYGLWQQVEYELESNRYKDSVEFRRAVGGYFGVETLEQVIKGGPARVPPAWTVARARLAEEVSAHAATDRRAATGDMFVQWWCPSPSPSPAARFFGELIEQFFPGTDSCE